MPRIKGVRNVNPVAGYVKRRRPSVDGDYCLACATVCSIQNSKRIHVRMERCPCEGAGEELHLVWVRRLLCSGCAGVLLRRLGLHIQIGGRVLMLRLVEQNTRHKVRGDGVSECEGWFQ
jgi:hypothetical protein